jgi:hypothetical protein
MFLSSLRPFRGAFAAVTLGIALVAIASCNEDDNSTTPPSTGTIGPAGGALVSSDDVFELLIPAGALSTNVTFTITAVDAPGGALASAYAIAPAGQAFSSPVVLSFSDQAIAVPALEDGGAALFHDITDYRVSAFASSTWTELANPSFDAIAGTVEGTTTTVSASAYSVIVPSGGSCVNVTETCPPADDGGCAVGCQPALPGKCAAYAGSIAESCTAAASSISVECCYPTGIPTCFTELEPNGCDNPCQQFPGSTTASCLPEVGPPLSIAASGSEPQSTCCFAAGAAVCMASHVSASSGDGGSVPTCASSLPCAAYPGTTVTSCTDVSDGTEATCCLPVGTLPTTLPAPGAALVDGGSTVSITDAAGSDANASNDAGGAADASGDASPALEAGADTGAGITDASDDGG